MKKRKVSRLLWVFMAGLFVSVAFYFGFRDSASWVPLIIPEFMGIGLIAVLTILVLRRKTSLSYFVAASLLVFAAGLAGFAYGRIHDVRFLVDLCPELLGSTGYAIALSVLFHKRVVMS